MRKIIAITLSILLMFSMIATGETTVATNLNESDIDGHWAFESMSTWIDKGLVKGYTDGTYRPDGNISKAEFITLINRILGYYEQGDDNYDDIAESEWFSEETAIAKNNNYMDWYWQEDLLPNQNITREEVSAILACITNINATEDLTAIDGFDDKDQISEWSIEYIDAIVNKGYMKGYEDNTLRPAGEITRAEAVTMIDRVVGVLIDQEGIYGPEEESETIDNNLTITVENVILQNTVITGDLILAAGIMDGDVELVNVTVEGRTIINGGGENSIRFTNCDLGEVIVLKIGGNIRVVSTDSKIGRMILQSGSRLEGDFSDVEVRVLKPGEEVEFDGSFEEVTLKATVKMTLDDKGHVELLTVSESGSGSEIDLQVASRVDKLVFEGAADVTGKGTITRAIVKADGATTEQEVGRKSVFPGIDGSGVKEEESSSSGSSSSSDSAAPVPGDSGILTTSAILDDSMVLSWTLATDNKTEQEDLEYLVYYSTSDNIDTVDNAETNGTAIGSYSVDIDTIKVIELSEGTTYYFNVVVKDEKGNKSVYGSISETTIDIGSGTMDDPYKVVYIEDLAKIGTGTDGWGLDKNYTLMNDLDFDDEKSYTSGLVDDSFNTGAGWQPIGDDTNNFTGSFDGNNKTISNLYINESDVSYKGLFGATSGGAISNLVIVDSDINGSYRVGSMVGYANGTTISNSYATGIINGGSSLGGLVGACDNSTMADVYAMVDIKGNSYMGGLTGVCSNTTIVDSYATGDVTGDEISNNGVGGLIGHANSSIITGNYAKGDVTGWGEVGGLIGYNKATTVDSCYAQGKVSAGGNSVGGLIGWNMNNSTVKGSYATGDVSSYNSMSDLIGGLVGFNYSGGTVFNSYAIGDVSGNLKVGGLLGEAQSNVYNSIAFNYNVTAANYLGRVIGNQNGGIGINTHAFLDMAIAEAGGTYDSGSDMTHNQFKDTAFYGDDSKWDTSSGEKWDFTDDVDGEGYWKIKSDRPVLYLGNGDGNTDNDPQVGDDDGLLPDITPPTPGDSANTTTSAITVDSVTLSWTKATDNKTAEVDLEYLAFYSTSDNIDTVENAESNGSAVGSYTTDINTVDIDGLDEATTYYFNVIVKDQPGNKGIYSTSSCKTAIDMGSGTSGDPYKIRYIEDLAKVGTGTDGWDLNDHYVLMNNLDFQIAASYESGSVDPAYTTGSGWNPIGRSGNFAGTFDGDGYTISNLYINNGTATGIGLFGFTEQADIKNLGLVDCNITGKEKVGSLVGQLYYSKVTTCYATGMVNGNLTDSNYLGGLVGWSEYSAIKKSYAESNVKGYGYIGGLVGYNYNQSSIADCYTTGIISGNYRLGGIAGEMSGATIAYSYAKGNVIGIGLGVNDFVGGLVGYMNSNARVTNSIAFNNSLTTSGFNIGRISGNTAGIYLNNYGSILMLLNGVSATTPVAISKDGADITPNDFANSIFYETDINWADIINEDGNRDGDPWDFTDTWEIKLGTDSPTLK